MHTIEHKLRIRALTHNSVLLGVSASFGAGLGLGLGPNRAPPPPQRHPWLPCSPHRAIMADAKEKVKASIKHGWETLKHGVNNAGG